MIRWQERTVDLSDLIPYERNPRKISKENFFRLKKSIQELGYHQRVICNASSDGKYRIIGGHQRLKIFRELGWKQLTILTPDRELSDAEFRRLLVQDNLPFGEHDFDILMEDFDREELLDWGMSEDLLPRETIIDPEEDELPEPPAEPISKPGDVWILGNHRLMCGDSTKADDVARLLGDVKPHLMVTDPPYGVEYDASWREKAGINGKNVAKGKVLNDDKADWREAWALFPGNIAYVWHAGNKAHIVAESLIACGFNIRAQIIWAKSQLVIGRGDYHHQHEPCWYAVKGTGNWTGDRKQTTLWQIDKPQKSETGHSTQKPVECMRRPMENNSSEGQAVYEPFSGSGTTIIAGEQIGRHVFAMELNPAYVDVAVKRWENFTKQKAVLEKKQ